MMDIITAMENRQIFGDTFVSPTWDVWKVLLRAIFGLPMDEEQRKVYTQFTGRRDVPTKQAMEAYLICGRRAGKSNISALITIYLACFRNYAAMLAPGETGVCVVIARDKRQAKVVFDYVWAFFKNPVLKKLVEGKTTDAIRLKSGIVIEVTTQDFKAVRNRTVICAVLDEMAFFENETTGQNPDHELVSALRPAMLTIEQPLLLGISSPYTQRGVLWEQYEQNFGREDAPALVWKASTAEMHPNVSKVRLAHAYLRDPVAADAEYGAQFRKDEAAGLVSHAVVSARVVKYRYELAPRERVAYRAFTDPSGGSSDSMTLSIAHSEGAKTVIDLIREVEAPFSPEVVTESFCSDLKRYGVTQVTGDNYSGRYAKDPFTKRGISYDLAERNRSELYLNLLPLLMSGTVELLDNAKLISQLARLERRTSNLGKDSVDHPKNEHDDVANCVAGVASLFSGANVVELSWANMVVAAMAKWGGAWWSHIGEKEEPAAIPEEPRGILRPERSDGMVAPTEANQSVLRHQAQVLAESAGVKCPECGYSGAMIVKRSTNFHCNSCAANWPAVAAVAVPVGGRRQLWKN
jgi:ribosomal protein S27E